MAAKKENKSNVLILSLIIAVCLSIPIFYVIFDPSAPDPTNPDSAIVDSSGNIRSDYDPGPAWLQSKPILVPNGHGGTLQLRANLRMKDRETAKTVCDRHPHLSDTILNILSSNTGLMDDALNGSSYAKRSIHDAIEDRLGSDMFTETILSDESLELMKENDKVRFECGHNGLRFVFKKPPAGYDPNKN